MQQQTIIIGYGDIGRRVAAVYLARGEGIEALIRDPSRETALREQGITPRLADLDSAESLQGLSLDGYQIYYFAPPSSDDAKDWRMRHLLTAIEGQRPHKLVYISTTGVYGDSQGAWVDESVPTHPNTDRARRRLDAETQLQQWGERHGVPVVILRVGGIYAEDRLPLRQLESARPVLRDEESGYTNRIHADDLAQICIAAMERGAGIYNVSDGQPGSMAQYFCDLAAALGYEVPERISLKQAQATLGPAMMSYLNESRRLDNRRLIDELGVTLQYPNLKAGIAAMLEAKKRETKKKGV